MSKKKAKKAVKKPIRLAARDYRALAQFRHALRQFLAFKTDRHPIVIELLTHVDSENPVFNEIRSLYGSRIKFIYRSFPLDIPAHDKAYDAAVAAQAAWMQGKFWEFENLLYSNQQAWSADPNYKQVWKGYAQQVGLDVTKWENDCLGLPAKQRVDDDKKRATSIPVGSTPTVYINDREVPFAQMTVEGLKSIIDAELAKAPPASGQPAAPAPNAANTTPAANTAGSSNAANGAKK